MSFERVKKNRQELHAIVASRFKRSRIEEDRLSPFEYEVRAHIVGEPSEAFFPPARDNVIVFDRHRITRSERRSRQKETVSSAKDRLLELAAQQRVEDAGNKHLVQGESGPAIFSSYMKTDTFQNMARELRNEMANPNAAELQGRVVGKIFEDLVFGLLSNTNNNNHVVLSPQRSYALTQALYPAGEFIERVFGQNSIKDNERVYIADGYSVNTETGLIEMGLEYTLNPHTEKKHAQIQKFNATKKRFPEMFSSNAAFVLVTHRDAIVDEFDVGKDVKLLKVPFSAKEMVRCFEGLWTR